MPSVHDTVRRLRTSVVVLVCCALLAAGAVLAVTRFTDTTDTTEKVATTPNPITPGNFTGYGFDQCEAPSQSKMTAWRKSSPFRAAGIYISGSLRYCQKQTYLTPAWVHTQLAAGWRLLPIHLGAQASCTTRDRYQVKKINPSPTDDYAAARTLGRLEAKVAVAAAEKLGIVARSTLYYDLEAFSTKVASCRISSLKFLSGWTNEIHAQGYVSGVYSSAASGMKVLDDARVAPTSVPGAAIALPDQIWIADWNGKADTSSTYIRSDGWPGRRIHQYQGGHNETWGGVTINIDRNYLDLRGQATTPPPVTTDARCTPGWVNSSSYRYTSPTQNKRLTTALQCILKQQALYTAPASGTWNAATTTAVKAWQKRVRHPQQTAFTRSDWVSLLSSTNTGTTLKPGVLHADVTKAQRSLNAASTAALKITGYYDAATQRAVRAYQVKLGIKPSEGIVARMTWSAFTAGRW